MAETARAWRQATDYNATHAANRRGSFENRDLRRTVDDETRAYLPTLLEDPCAYCGDESTEFDHIVAESHGGSSTWDNLVGVCRSCNAQKQQLGPISYLLYRRLRADAEEIAQQRALLRLAA